MLEAKDQLCSEGAGVFHLESALLYAVICKPFDILIHLECAASNIPLSSDLDLIRRVFSFVQSVSPEAVQSTRFRGFCLPGQGGYPCLLIARPAPT